MSTRQTEMAPTTSDRDDNSPGDRDNRKRVTQACDRCRLKKIKCDGNIPCGRCRSEEAVCHFGARRKGLDRSVPAGYVDQLELQQKILVKALKETWKLYVLGDKHALEENVPSVHTIVETLGFLNEAGLQHSPQGTLNFDDDLKYLRQTPFSEDAFSEGYFPTGSSTPGAFPTDPGGPASFSPVLDFGERDVDMATSNSQSWEGIPTTSVAGGMVFSSNHTPLPSPAMAQTLQYLPVPHDSTPVMHEPCKGRTTRKPKASSASNERRTRGGKSSQTPQPTRRQAATPVAAEEVSDETWSLWINEDPR